MIVRTYACETCEAVFEVDCESNDGDPPCPACEMVMEWRPQRFSIKTNKSRAMDVAETVLREDYALDNWKDGSREGDVAAIMPSETTSEREARMKIENEVKELAETVKVPENPAQAAAVSAFWGGGSGQAGAAAQPNQLMAQTLMASTKVGPQAGVDPIRALHSLGREGKLPNNMRIIARG